MNGKEINKYLKEDEEERRHAISHVVSSARYWTGDTIDNSYYSNNLVLECAFEEAVVHVKREHYKHLTHEDIEEARNELGLNKQRKVR